MTFISWATHVLQGFLQKEAKKKFGANLLKIILVRIVGWNLPYMKMESLVIVDQHATVNEWELCTHRPSRQGSNSDSLCFNLLKNI